MPDTPGSPIKFPTRTSGNAGGPALTLPRRRSLTRSPFELSAASAEARKQISEIVLATRAPFGQASVLEPSQASVLERTLRDLEAKLAEREHALVESEARLADRERDLAESEALITARQKLIDAARNSAPARATVSKEEQAALEQLRAELDRLETSLKEQKAALLERERFIDENEAKLFEKMMQQQETETQLEQRKEDIAAKEKRLQAPGTKPPDAPPAKFDEFNE